MLLLLLIGAINKATGSYGDQIIFHQESWRIVSSLERHWQTHPANSFYALLLHLGKQRQELAFKQTGVPSSFGLLRDAKSLSITPITKHTYPQWHAVLKKHFLHARNFQHLHVTSDDHSVTWDTRIMRLIELNADELQIVQKLIQNSHFKNHLSVIRTHITLTPHSIFGMSIYALTSTTGKNLESQSFSVIHAPASKGSLYKLCEALWHELLIQNSQKQSILPTLARFQYYFAFLMPYSRGSAAINEWIGTSLLGAQGIRLASHLLQGIDQKAFMARSLTDFEALHASLVTK